MSEILRSKEENWKDIPEYEGLYQVSDLGRVKSLKFGKERVLKAGTNSSGYLMVVICKDKKQKTAMVHQLMAMAFLNHKPNGNTLVVDHINNVSTDNRLSNLQLISNRENTSKDKKGGSSKYVGVYWNKATKKWVAHIKINGKLKHLGYFEEEVEAHNAYQSKLNEVLCGIN